MTNIDGVKKSLPKNTWLLGEYRRWLVFLDAGKEEFWWMPEIQKISNITWRVGWGYWALVIMDRGHA